MLTTLIYRSQIPLTHEINLSLLVEKANVNNMSHGVSGILLFKDNVILQVLEGDESILEQLFSKIKHDSRHFGVVELMRDYAPRRRFENVGMMYFDLDTLEADAVLKTVRQLSKLKSYLLTEERVYKFIHTFITQKELSRFPSISSLTNGQLSHKDRLFIHLNAPQLILNAASLHFSPLLSPWPVISLHWKRLFVIKMVGVRRAFLLQSTIINVMKLTSTLNRWLSRWQKK